LLHDPFEQVPLVPAPMQVIPLPTHVPETQQPPDWQLFAAQQACPAAPQLCPPGPTVVDDELPPQDAPSAENSNNRTNSRQTTPLSKRRIIIPPLEVSNLNSLESAHRQRRHCSLTP
jgi:hypothetical protein